MITVAVLLPTKGRPLLAAAVVETLLSQPALADARLLVVLAMVEGDRFTVPAIRQDVRYDDRLMIITRPSGSTAVEGWNMAYEAAADAGADWFVLGADDVEFDEYWLAEALAAAEKANAQVVGLNDGDHTDLRHYGPHYMASRRFCQQVLGDYMVPPVYSSWWFDREICERAQQLGVYAPAWRARLVHQHPDWQAAVLDETYVDAWPSHDLDRAIYLDRRQEYAS